MTSSAMSIMKYYGFDLFNLKAFYGGLPSGMKRKVPKMLKSSMIR